MVIKAKNEEEVSFILKESFKLAIPVTFRAAGTSLSGQAISYSVLDIAENHWTKFKIDPDGLKFNSPEMYDMAIQPAEPAKLALVCIREFHINPSFIWLMR